MTGAALVERLEQDFRRIETPFTVTFDSPEDARALLMGFGGAYTASLPEWRERQSPALLAIARHLAPTQRSPDQKRGKAECNCSPGLPHTGDYAPFTTAGCPLHGERGKG
jgi:hypothetical protein